MSLPNGSVVEGVVTRIANFGAFVQLPDNSTGMVHISEVSQSYVRDINEFLKVGDKTQVMVMGMDENNRINLSIRRAMKGNARPLRPASDAFSARGDAPATFDDMVSRFMKESEEKLSDYKRSIGRRSGGYARRG